MKFLFPFCFSHFAIQQLFLPLLFSFRFFFSSLFIRFLSIFSAFAMLYTVLMLCYVPIVLRRIARWVGESLHLWFEGQNASIRFKIHTITRSTYSLFLFLIYSQCLLYFALYAVVLFKMF